jgi:hypothetical protein
MKRIIIAVASVVAVLGGIMLFALYEERSHQTGWSLGPPHASPPKQPIRYSHKLHAGKRQIACTYCHQFADRAEAAGIPSMDTCLGCHRNLKSTDLPEWEQAEIAKFISGEPPAAALKNPDNPPRWSRVYDLPDHIHFPHKVHVWALATRHGKIPEAACSTCHGDVASMDESGPRQAGPWGDIMRMGSCMSCHERSGAGNDCWTCHK